MMITFYKAAYINLLADADLVGSIGSAKTVAKIVDGKRSIDPIQAKALSEYFQVSASLFI